MAAPLRSLTYQFHRCVAVRASTLAKPTATTVSTSFERSVIQGSAIRLFTSDDKRNFESVTETDSKSPKAKEVAEASNPYSVEEIVQSFNDTSYYDPLERPDYSQMTNEELEDFSNIPGWDLIHSPPKDRSVPRGALVGTVVSTKMQKTVNVAVDRYKVHPKYKKRIRYTRKFMAHDENEVANTGDMVMIVPCHRISRHKHFMLREIIRAKGQL